METGLGTFNQCGEVAERPDARSRPRAIGPILSEGCKVARPSSLDDATLRITGKV